MRRRRTGGESRPLRSIAVLALGGPLPLARSSRSNPRALRQKRATRVRTRACTEMGASENAPPRPSVVLGCAARRNGQAPSQPEHRRER